MNEAQYNNRDKLVALFQAGCKQSQMLGFELEHVLLHTNGDAPVAYSEPGGVHDVIERLAPRYRSATFDDGHVIGLSRCRETISIEPNGQLEISAGPYKTVGEIARAYQEFRALLDPILDEFGLYAPMVGYNPSAKAEDLLLVPKKRYECMTEFLGAQSYSALCMMRGTASLQISVDYANERDAILKLRTAQKLTPILALISDNVAVFETHPVQGHMARTGVWLGMWQDRVGTIPGSLDPAFGFAEYADYIMTRQAILVPDSESEGGWRYEPTRTFDQIYADRDMNETELEHALSMVWPDARLKNFVEIRPADAMPAEFAYAYTALVKSLFYNQDALAQFDSELSHVDEKGIADAKRALMKDGYGGHIYGKPVTHWCDEVMEVAQQSASSEDARYLEPLANLVAHRRTLKD